MSAQPLPLVAALTALVRQLAESQWMPPASIRASQLRHVRMLAERRRPPAQVEHASGCVHG